MYPTAVSDIIDIIRLQFCLVNFSLLLVEPPFFWDWTHLQYLFGHATVDANMQICYYPQAIDRLSTISLFPIWAWILYMGSTASEL